MAIIVRDLQEKRRSNVITPCPICNFIIDECDESFFYSRNLAKYAGERRTINHYTEDYDEINSHLHLITPELALTLIKSFKPKPVGIAMLLDAYTNKETKKGVGYVAKYASEFPEEETEIQHRPDI